MSHFYSERLLGDVPGRWRQRPEPFHESFMRTCPRIACVLGCVPAIFAFGPGLICAQQAAVAEKGDGITVLARGPVHEAFAQPVNSKPEPSPAVSKQPPAPIPEVPPEQRPSDPNAQWIPGYWGWDPEKQDWLWVSGVWRIPPPGRRWVSGHWAQSADGWQRVAGMWVGESRSELQYLTPPPASLDHGPNSPEPDDRSTYVPGTWIFKDNDWVWRPGYWRRAYDGWIWNPSCYSWTPAGDVYNDGYWDYDLNGRGLLFAPVAFDSPLWNNPGWSYTPNCVVNTGGLLDSLFFGPGCCCYWFGNCYSPFFRGCGFQPWCFHGARCFDPLFCHGVWSNRGNPFWAQGLRNGFAARVNGTAPVPALTLAGQRALFAGSPGLHSNLNLVSPVAGLSQNGAFGRATAAQIGRQRTASAQFQQLSAARGRAEWSVARSTSFSGRTSNAMVLGSFRLPANGVSHASDVGTVPAFSGVGGRSSGTGVPRSAGIPSGVSSAPVQNFARPTTGPTPNIYRGPSPSTTAVRPPVTTITPYRGTASFNPHISGATRGGPVGGGRAMPGGRGGHR
jgi:hypothetical protein